VPQIDDNLSPKKADPMDPPCCVKQGYLGLNQIKLSGCDFSEIQDEMLTLAH
jgi:hypothetical protein